MSVEWDPALAVGHAEIDGQHMELFCRLDRLVAAMEAGVDHEIPIHFDLFGDYAAKHFAAEEKVMSRTGYPGANVHAAAHARFLREYAELRALYEVNGAIAGVAVKTRTWIEGWLRTHIRSIDVGFARHLRARVPARAEP